MEIKVPDIGDFKDVEVIEVLVATGQKIKKNDLGRPKGRPGPIENAFRRRSVPSEKLTSKKSIPGDPDS